jgi:peptidoglycan lytic transglycosylase
MLEYSIVPAAGWGMMRGRASSALGRFAPVGACAALCFSLANCANIDPRYGVEPSARLVAPGAPVPKGGGVYRVGSPYVVAGRVYIPQDNPHYRADGVASWYGSDFHGRSTANGEIFDADAITAAHPTLPLPKARRLPFGLYGERNGLGTGGVCQPGSG